VQLLPPIVLVELDGGIKISVNSGGGVLILCKRCAGDMDEMGDMNFPGIPQEWSRRDELRHADSCVCACKKLEGKCACFRHGRRCLAFFSGRRSDHVNAGRHGRHAAAQTSKPEVAFHAAMEELRSEWLAKRAKAGGVDVPPARRCSVLRLAGVPVCNKSTFADSDAGVWSVKWGLGVSGLLDAASER